MKFIVATGDGLLSTKGSPLYKYLTKIKLKESSLNVTIVMLCEWLEEEL